MTIITPGFLQALRVSFTGSFSKAFAGAKSYYMDVAMVTNSTTSKGGYHWLGQMPRLREWLGDRRLKSLEAFGFTIANKDFEMTISVRRNDIEDDNVGVYTPLFEEMGRAAATHPDELVFSLLPRGFSEPCYDNQNFFDDSHPIEDKDGNATTWSNMQAGSGEGWYLLDTSRAVRPLIYQKRRPYTLVSLDQANDQNVFMQNTYIYGCEGRSNAGYGLWQLAFGSKLALNEANYSAARAQMSELRGDGGKLLGVRPTVIVVPPSLETAARNLFEKQNLAGGESNIRFNELRVIVADWLAE